MTLRSQASRRTVLAFATILATLLYTIDATIVNVALPHMQGSLQATQDQVAWVLTSYIVMSAIAMPLAGWLGARFGLRRVLAISVAGFTASSIACGLATHLDEMVLFRLVQGAFGAALVPLSQVALLQEYPYEQHGRVTAMWTLGVLVGPVIGPALGGYLTDAFSWRWAFLINAPVGIVAYLGIVEGLPADHVDHSRPFDWLGFVLLSLALGLFQLMLDRGHTLDWFASPEIVAEAFFGGLCFYMFVVHMLTARHPFVDPALFRDRNFVVALALMFAIGLSILSPMVLVPSFLQSLQGYTPAQAGLLQATRGASSIVTVLIAGRLLGRIDSRFLIGAGVLAGGLSLMMLSGLTLDTPRGDVAFACAVVGISSPLVFVPLSVSAYATLMPEQRTEAGVMLTLLRNIGSSIGISVAVAMLAHSTQVNQSYLVEHFSAYDVARWQTLGTQAGANTSTAEIVAEIGRQAATIAYSNDYWMLAAATLAVLPLVLLLRVRKGAPSQPVEVGELG